MARPHVEILRSGDAAPSTVPGSGWPAGAVARVLSADPASGACSLLVTLPPGWARPAGSHPATAVDVFVVEGALAIGGAARAAGFHGWWPAGAAQAAWEAGPEGCTLFLGARDGAPDLAAGAGPALPPAAGLGAGPAPIEQDTMAMLWEVAPEGPPDEQISGLPPGIVMKTLRWVEETGEVFALCATVPRWDYPRLEFHECVEEAFMLRGSIWMGTSGLMAAGDYFWRPPYVTHGPFWSQDGCLFLVYTDTLLVDHVAERPGSTPDENRALLARQRATGASA